MSKRHQNPLGARRPRWTANRLLQVLERTNGKCHLCGGKLESKNYGKSSNRGGWEVDHSRPIAGAALTTSTTCSQRMSLAIGTRARAQAAVYG
jgi:hypothetical protein